MANVDDAINDLFFLERRFKNLMEVIPELQKYSSLAVAINERKAQLKKADELLAATKTDIAAVAAEMETLKVSMSDLLKDTKDKAQGILEKAKQDGQSVVTSAEAKAENLVLEAEAKAASISEASDKASKELEETKTLLAVQKQNYEDILARINELKSRL